MFTETLEGTLGWRLSGLHTSGLTKYDGHECFWDTSSPFYLFFGLISSPIFSYISPKFPNILVFSQTQKKTALLPTSWPKTKGPKIFRVFSSVGGWGSDPKYCPCLRGVAPSQFFPFTEACKALVCGVPNIPRYSCSRERYCKRQQKYQKWVIHRKLRVPRSEGSVLFPLLVQI